ncbi:MAG: transglycosylase family protein [Solirubrobacterales bacterium]|nr:transglycosylase family protein [Solirubrobacterales bacterium]
MNMRRRTLHRRPVIVALAATGVLGALATVPMASAGQNLNQLNSELGQQQSRQHALEASLAGLSQLISSLSGQISFVQTREAEVQAQVTQDRARVIVEQADLTQAENRLAVLRDRLARSRGLLGRQLLSNYESGSPDLVTVVLESNGFNDLLEKITYLKDAEHQQQAIITVTRVARARVAAATQRLSALELRDRQITYDAWVHEQALAGMNSLLQSKQSALKRAQSIKESALSASRSKAGQLQTEISQIEAQQAAQRAAAAQAAAQAAQSAAQQAAGPVATGPALGPSGGWAIPYQIVLCESGGQNLPPNSAGASGYYQIMPATWRLFGGTGPAAYLASKSEQDAVAGRIWRGGAGWSNWVCAQMLGIH